MPIVLDYLLKLSASSRQDFLINQHRLVYWYNLKKEKKQYNELMKFMRVAGFLRFSAIVVVSCRYRRSVSSTRRMLARRLRRK